MAPNDTGASRQQRDRQAASGRPVGVSTTTYGAAALRLLDNGYEPIPIVPGTKRPALPRWSDVAIDEAAIARWTRQYPGYGIGLRTGMLVGVDIDILDPDAAYAVAQLTQARLGDTLIRVGRWPKRLLTYRTEVPFPKVSIPGLEVLGRGQQFIGFGLHPDTGQPYHWPDGETPLEVPFEALPLIDPPACDGLLAEVRALAPPAATGSRRNGRRDRKEAQAAVGIDRDADGRVVDGRDGWLSSIAYHAVHDAIGAGVELDADVLGAVTWGRFAATADLVRPSSRDVPYTVLDATRKVADKLRLLADGRLPPRETTVAEADYQAPSHPAAAAREQLEAMLSSACAQIETWLAEPEGPAPRIGIKATVGLGKSAIARRQLLALRARLIAAGGPSRLLVLTPSHVLAEEAEAAWRSHGVTVAVLHGYEAKDPRTGNPMCRDVPAVRAAIEARSEVHETACASAGRRCAFFDGCLKQRNRAEVAAAEVVVAVHHALFTGFAMETGTIAAIMIDEGMWSTAIREDSGIGVASFATELLGRSLGRRGSDDAIADLHDLRSRAVQALACDGPVLRSRLIAAGLDAEACQLAATLEARRLRDAGLYPGMPEAERGRVGAQMAINALTHRFVELWQGLAELAAGEREQDGRAYVRRSGTGSLEVVVTGVRAIHPTLQDKPILHLDATLRLELASSVLPGLRVQEIEAAMPDMSLRLVLGSFGKSALCAGPELAPDEAQRRANRLREVVDYVAWQARRFVPGRILVVTYKDCEAAFADIPGVETGHFNAIAGLDAYRDVRLLVVVGRPLPSDLALLPLSAALFRHLPEGGYLSQVRGVRMRDGSSRSVRAMMHTDEKAEVLRAAICDDEVVQAIGRGRGVNRTPHDPLEVHLMADVALPLVHDQLLAWEAVRPDLMQRMLLAGIAVDSPGDALRLHPALFSSAAAAEKAFQREEFGGHFPIRDLYRGMSAKPAAYRRAGPGRSMQRAWWIDGHAADARTALETSLGPLAIWKPG